jgi:hypothetical protein
MIKVIEAQELGCVRRPPLNLKETAAPQSGAEEDHDCCIYPIGMTVAWKPDPIRCKRSEPDVNHAYALHITVGSTDFPRCQMKLKIKPLIGVAAMTDGYCTVTVKLVAARV